MEQPTPKGESALLQIYQQVKLITEGVITTERLSIKIEGESKQNMSKESRIDFRFLPMIEITIMNPDSHYLKEGDIIEIKVVVDDRRVIFKSVLSSNIDIQNDGTAKFAFIVKEIDAMQEGKLITRYKVETFT